MPSAEDVVELLKRTSPAGARARAVVLERARRCRFKQSGVTDKMIDELTSLGSLKADCDEDLAWAQVFRLEIEAAVRSMEEVAVVQEVRLLLFCLLVLTDA